MSPDVGSSATGDPALGEPATGEPATEEPEPELPESGPDRTKPGRPVLIGLAVVLLGSTAAVTVYLERVVYRFGEKLSGRGVRLAHTRIGVALAVLSTVATVAADNLRDRRRRVEPV